MKATQILLLVCLGLGLAVAAGCDKDYTIIVRNYTSEIQNVQIADSTGFPEREFTVPADGGRRETFVRQDENSVESYALKTNKLSQSFTISKQWNDQAMFFHIGPKEIVGPVDKNAKVSMKWDDTTNVKTAPQFKVTGD